MMLTHLADWLMAPVLGTLLRVWMLLGVILVLALGLPW